MNQNNGLQGFEAPAQSISDFQYGEKTALQSPKSEWIVLNVPTELQARKIYLWLWADASSSTDYFVQGVISFWKNGGKIGSMPVAVGALPSSGPLTVSLATVGVTGGNASQDSMGLYVANPQGSQPSTVILQPLYIVGVCDQIKLDIQQIRNISNTTGLGIRAFLGAISSQK
jgi:hypothetical protein